MQDNQFALRNAAILIDLLDAQSADALLERIPAQQAARVRQMLIELADVKPQEQNEVLVEFFRVAPRSPSRHPPGIELDGGTSRRLQSMTPMYDPGPPGPSPPIDSEPFEFLQQAPDKKLMPLLEGEHPQTIALVVSHLPSDRAALILQTLPPAVQADVIGRLVDLDQTDPEILREVERGLKSRFDKEFLADTRRVAGLAAVKRIFQGADARVKTALMKNLAAHDRQLAARLAEGAAGAPFTFQQLDLLDDAALLTVFQAASPQIVVLSLAGAAAALARRIEGLLPSHEARQLRRDVQNLGPTRLSDIERAQQEVVSLARRLQSEGRVDLHPARSPSLLGSSAPPCDPAVSLSAGLAGLSATAPTIASLPNLPDTYGPARATPSRSDHNAAALLDYRRME